jgi:hypothetical protein
VEIFPTLSIAATWNQNVPEALVEVDVEVVVETPAVVLAI